MTSTLRRRLHHGDVGGKKNEHFDSLGSDDGLNEPLLGYQNYDDRDQVCTLEDVLDEGRRRERLHWTLLFSHLISQWAQWYGAKGDGGIVPPNSWLVIEVELVYVGTPTST